MQRRFAHRQTRDMLLLAGWLFADLLLALMVIFLISAPGAIPQSLICALTPTTPATSHNLPGNFQTERLLGVRYSALVVTQVPALRTHPVVALRQDVECPTATPTSTATLTPTPNKNAISKTPMTFSFHANADALLAGDSAEKARLQGIVQQQLGAAFSSDDQAGFVLSFGTSPDPQEGEQLADDFDSILQSAMPTLFTRATLRPFHDIGSDRGAISIEIYLFVIGG